MIGATPEQAARAPAGRGRPGRHHRHRRRGLAPGHRAELQRRAVAQLHVRHPEGAERRDRRRPVRGGGRQVLLRRARRRRQRPRHARRRHDRRRRQPVRHRRRRAGGRARQPARRPGLRLLLPAADRRRAHLRRRQRDRRREHVVLHRPVALQLPRQPGGLAGRAGAAAARHRRDPARPAVRPQPRRHAGRRRGQRPHRPRQAGVRRHEPGLPAGGRPARAHGRQLVPDHADRGPRRHRRHLGGAEQAQGVLLRLRPRAGRRVRPGRRRARHRAARARRTGSSRRTPTRSARRRPPTRRRRPTSSRRTATTGRGCRARRWPRRTWPASSR